MDEHSGMGSRPAGPSFAAWNATGATSPTGPGRTDPSHTSAEPTTGQAPLFSPSSHQPASPPTALRPPRNPWPTLLTLLALLVVGSIVVASTVIGSRATRPVATGVAAPVGAPAVPVPAAPARSDRMEFVTDDGDGVLIITSSRWTTTGLRRPTFGSYLHVQVQLVCSSGQLDFGPENFSAFDAAGELFEVTETERSGTPLGDGTLWAGESVRGGIVFDLPRGEVTLLLSDSSSNSVTAVKIPD